VKERDCFLVVCVGYVAKINGKCREDEKRGTWKVGNLKSPLML